MKTRTIATALPLVLLAPLAGVDDLSFAPKNGTSVIRTFSEELTYTLEEMTQIVGGQEMEQDLPDFTGSNSRSVVVTDEYTEVEDGHPKKLKRSFGEIGGESTLEISVDGGSESYEFEVESELTDSTALFTRGDDGKVKVTDEEGVAKEAFTGLIEDMDLRGFLPSEKVEKFGTWEVEPQALVDAFRAGGDKRTVPTDTPDGDYFMLTPTQVIAASLVSLSELQSATGEIGATWEETKKEGESELAVIALEVEITSIGDGTDRIAFLLDEIDVEGGEEDLTVDMELTLEGTGQLVWNLTENRFESFTLESEVTMEIALTWVQDFGGQEVDLEIEVGLSGESQFEAALKAE